jgi:hypothetical protein
VKSVSSNPVKHCSFKMHAALVFVSSHLRPAPCALHSYDPPESPFCTARTGGFPTTDTSAAELAVRLKLV